MCKQTFIPGTVRMLTYLTPKALAIDGKANDSFIMVFEDCPGTLLGAGTSKTQAASDIENMIKQVCMKAHNTAHNLLLAVPLSLSRKVPFGGRLGHVLVSLGTHRNPVDVGGTLLEVLDESRGLAQESGILTGRVQSTGQLGSLTHGVKTVAEVAVDHGGARLEVAELVISFDLLIASAKGTLDVGDLQEAIHQRILCCTGHQRRIRHGGMERVLTSGVLFPLQKYLMHGL